ncbi:MAG: hypothetical protein NTZ95_07850, partial [Candidatus Omnitrophica bacterium]|nr:hypothetical protein [Candidatus Omnitrophota bacterium]
MKRLNKIISSVVLVCFIWNTAVQDYAFGLATMPGSTQPDTREAMFAAGQKELATHEYGPGSGISDKLDKYSPGQFIGDVPAVNWLEFVPTSNEDGIPDGWEKNPILQKTNLVKAFEYFRDHEADLDETRLEIVEGDFKLEKGNSGEIPICRIEQDARTLRYRLVIHKDFVRMWADIKKNDVQFKYRFPDGTVRTVSLAWAIFYRIAKHEMSDIVSRDGKGQFTPKSHGHMEYILPHPGWFGTSEVHDEESDERAANEIRGKYAIVNDGLWMWFLGSYCFGPATQYSDVMFKDRALWFLGLYEGPKAEEWNRWAVEHELPYEFPNLRDAAARAEALSIARAVNKRFYTNYNRYEASASPESETRMARDLTERTPRILKVLPATGISTSSNKAFLQKLNAYIDNKKAMDVLLANPDNWKDKAQDILDLKNKVSFALEELWMESEVVALSTEERAGAVVVKSIKDGDLLCNHRTKEVFRFSEAERGRVMTQAQEIVILQPLSLTVGERKTRDELVTKLRSNDRDIKGRMVAIKALKSMVESGILPKPFEVGDVFQHCHSTYSHSPGNTPSYIAWRGYVLGLMVTGIVDHDTVGGFKEFRQAAGILGLRNPTSGYEQRVMPKGTPFETMTTNSPGNKGETYVAFHGIARDKHEMQEKKVVPAKVKRFTKIASLINEIAGLGLDYKRHIKPLTEAGNPTEKHVAEAIAQLIYEKFKDDIGRGEWSGVVGCANRIIAECCKRAGETRDLTIVKQSDVDKTKDLTKFTFLIRDRVVTVAKQIPGYAPTEDEVIRDSEVYEDAHRHNELVYYCYLGDLKKCEAENRTILTRAEKDKFLEEKGRGGIKDATIQRWLDKEDASMLHLWFSYQRDMGVDGIAFMPNRNRPQEVEDVIKIAEEVGFKHIANGMDVNTPDMPFTYFDYSNRQAFVEESLFIVEHERKMRQTAAALNHSICNALVSLAVENQNELNNMFRGFTFVEYDKKHKVYWFGHRLGSKSNFLDIFNMLVRLTAREKGYDAVGAQDEKDTLNKIVTRAGLAASATYLNLESVKKSLGLQAEHVDVETGTVYIMTEHKGTELGSRMIRHARFERGLHLALTRSSGHDMAAYKLWRLGSPLQWLINSSLRVGGKEYVLSSSKSGMMCTYNEFAQMAHNTANEYYPIEARDVSEGMDFAYSVNAVISSLAVDRDVEGRIMDGMAKAMDDGLAGQPSSLKMIPAYVGAATGEEEGDYFAIDVGGTNLRVLGVRLEKGKKPSLIGNTEKAAIPSSITKGGTAEELFGFIVSTIKEYARKNGIDPKSGMKFGITWSFPVEQTGVASGIHKEWTKGWDVSGVVGQDPVALLHAALAREGLQSVRIMAMCNDTVGTLMFGDIGVILGTGTNAAFPIAVKDIGKFNGKTDLDVMAINSEWGNFDGVPTKAWDDLLDRISNNPGKQKLEKMISGMYLGAVARHIINMLISDGKLFNGRQYPVFENKPVESGKDGFTPELMSNIRKVDPATDPDLIGAETILAGIGVTETTPSDRRIVRDICNAVSLRAAKVSASVLAAMIKKSGVLERKDICRVAIDGSVFKHDYRFKEMMELALVEIFGADVAARIELVLAEDGSGVGAAIIAAVADRSEKTAASRSGTATVPNPHDEMTGEGDTSKNALRRDLGLDREAPARTPALSTEMVQTHDWTVREIATANWVNEADAVREIVSYLITEGGSRELAVIVDELMVNSDEKLN